MNIEILIHGFFALVLSIFLVIFIRKKDKSYAEFMMIVLTISYLIIQIIIIPHLEGYFLQDEKIATIYFCVSSVCFIFSLFWAAAFAIFTHRVLISTGMFPFKRFIATSFILCTIFASLQPILALTHSIGLLFVFVEGEEYYLEIDRTNPWNKYLYILVNDIISWFLPVMITAFAYFKVFKILDEVRQMYAQKISPWKTFWFPITLIVCFIPGIIADVMFAFDVTDWREEMETLGTILQDLGGILNLSVFLFIKPVEERRESRLSMEDFSDYFQTSDYKE